MTTLSWYIPYRPFFENSTQDPCPACGDLKGFTEYFHSGRHVKNPVPIIMLLYKEVCNCGHSVNKSAFVYPSNSRYSEIKEHIWSLKRVNAWAKEHETQPITTDQAEIHMDKWEDSQSCDCFKCFSDAGGGTLSDYNTIIEGGFVPSDVSNDPDPNGTVDPEPSSSSGGCSPDSDLFLSSWEERYAWEDTQAYFRAHSP